ncbi:TerC family protein [Herbaspirillum huttiense F1]|uniref:TerC family protein n=1 Tax=Herbaspirillum huttiense subsp. lycopersici TaxID=3074428 RepID=A0ABU2EPD3_9BURK|nr:MULTISPECIES: TerC family protein [Herbaspirillum]MBP1318181.1 tellurite resistance protein TerC [Herbaspirillum sp. 1130]MDR6742655.1 tellurite resistance protein TerC [Herbaspirillum sp. 1173]MDR9850033.1 TerC family protein [Herbaspirillum huttiense SE1]MDT0358828.1 TerC family protein [Herbaspirillum huttiense F1]
MNGVESFASLPMWIGFIVFVLGMLAVDMFALGGRNAHRVSPREALSWSVVWVSLAFLFAGLMWWYLDANVGREFANQKGAEFLSGYLIEKALSVDNIFVFLMIFSYFAVPAEMQRRVLLYGVIGAIVMRAVMILLGAWMIAQFSWILYVFGAFLVFTGIKMLIFADKEADLGDNPLLRWLRGHMKISDNYDGENFTTRINGVRYFTPLMLVLLLIEISDVIFAVDSIPAIFAITKDPFIVFTSNMFAIMGLRALYFLLADSAERFHLLKYGLALVLLFVGGKMLASYWFHVPVLVSLSIVGAILVISIIASLVLTKGKDKETTAV